MNLRPNGIYADVKYRCSTLVGLAVPEQQSGLILSRQRISDDKRARVQTIRVLNDPLRQSMACLQLDWRIMQVGSGGGDI
jgi:hypothetical protein